MLIYTSKESLSTLASSYKNYYQNKNLTQNSEDIQADEFSILGREEGKYAVTITGNASSSDKDLNEVTVIWGEE